MDAELAEEVIQSSRLKTVLYLVISVAFTAISPLLIRSESAKDQVVGWLCLALFGTGVVVFVWTLIRPMSLVLDSHGFTLSGGLVRKPRRELWSDITGFHVWSLPRGGTMIGYGYVPGARKPSALRSFNQSMGAEAALPKGWKLGPKAMVERLNDYRERALNAGGPTQTPTAAHAHVR
jgi:hypothetical protein